MNTKFYTLLREANKSTQASKRSEMLFMIEHDQDGKPHSGTVVQFFDEHNEMCDDFMIQDEGHTLVISSRLSYPIQTIRRVFSMGSGMHRADMTNAGVNSSGQQFLE